MLLQKKHDKVAITAHVNTGALHVTLHCSSYFKQMKAES